LKQEARSAGARIVAPELLEQFLVAPHDAVTALDLGLGREALAALARDLESTVRLQGWSSWHTSSLVVELR